MSHLSYQKRIAGNLKDDPVIAGSDPMLSFASVAKRFCTRYIRPPLQSLQNVGNSMNDRDGKIS